MCTVYSLENMDTASKIRETAASQNQLLRIDLICLITKLIYELTLICLSTLGSFTIGQKQPLGRHHS